MLDAGGARPGGTITRNLVASQSGDVVSKFHFKSLRASCLRSFANLKPHCLAHQVTNHYILPDGRSARMFVYFVPPINHVRFDAGSHGTAVHYVRAGGRITSSFWYGGAVSSNELGTRCGTATEGCSIQIVRDFYAAIDQNPPTANGVEDLDLLVGACPPVFRS